MRVIVTGASRGMGKAIAEIFAKAGWEVLISARNQAKLDAVAQEIMQRNPGSKVMGKAADATIPDQVRAFGAWCLEQGEPDVLVNNAGIFEPGKLLDQAEGVMEGQLAVNLYSAYHLTRVIAPSMVKRGQGHIFNMCSIAALKAYDNGGSYSISKWALTGFTKNLREEMKPHNIKVSMIHPGATYTPSWEMSGIEPTRFMKPEDVAQMVLASCKLSAQACVEEIIMRPQLGDI